MKLAECKICEKHVEYHSYGHPTWDNDVAPYDFPICYGCIKKIREIILPSDEKKN